jgi:hypothetical protein
MQFEEKPIDPNGTGWLRIGMGSAKETVKQYSVCLFSAFLAPAMAVVYLRLGHFPEGP